MYDLDKISQDVDNAVKKYKGWRGAAKSSGINMASLESYFAKTVKEPREPNIRKLADAMGRDITYYYKTPGQDVEKKEGKTVPMEEHMQLLKEHVACLKELNDARKQINRLTALPTGADAPVASSGEGGR